MEQSEHNNKEENLEEGREDVGVTTDKEDEGDEGGDASIEDRRPDVDKGARGSGAPATVQGQEGVADVGGVVNTQPCNRQFSNYFHISTSVSMRFFLR